MIEINNITKVYGKAAQKTVALNNVSVVLPENKFITIVGKSGSGKTTMLNMLGLLDAPDCGSIKVSDISIFDMTKKERLNYRRSTVGIVFQFFMLIPVITVKENILLATKNVKKYDKEYFGEIVEALDISDVLNKYPDELSGGEKQRVAIARAIINKPKLLLADEPTGNLDTENSRRVISLLKKLSAKYNMTLIVVTHDDDIRADSDYVVRLLDGQVVYDGASGECK